jgi:phosphoenolpyruvate phosphomutase
MIIARIESFIAGRDINDAMERAQEYVRAGADGIMIHSKDKSGNDIKEFCKRLRTTNKNIPIVVVPTTYNHIAEPEFETWGANVVIYANHMLRSSYPAMLNTAKSILTHQRSYEADEYCMSVKEILELIPGTKYTKCFLQKIFWKFFKTTILNFSLECRIPC